MTPVSRKVMHSGNYLQPIAIGANTVIGSIKGSVKKLGVNYQDAMIVLYNKTNLLPIAIRKPDINGNYQILGLNKSLACFIVAFDLDQQYNAVIQDNVVPK